MQSPTRPCARCGQPVTPPRREYCSDECATAARRARDQVNHRRARARDKNERAELDYLVRYYLTGVYGDTITDLRDRAAHTHAALTALTDHLNPVDLPRDTRDALTRLATELDHLHAAAQAAAQRAQQLQRFDG